jgi:general secretion pathway protein D
VVRNPDGTTTTTTGISPDLIEQGAAALAGITGGVAGIGFRAGDALFGAILNAVRSDNTSNLLSIPSTFTLDNQEARFLVGQEIPITTGEALSPNFDNAFRTVQRQNVGITLQVRPQINAGGAIKMDLRVEVSSIAGPAAARSQDFILNKRESENTLVVEDGEIAVIGGLLDENERRTIEKIPLLGDLPVIGNLFRSRGRERNKTNLMIFIRPTIVRSPAEQRAVAARRYDYIRDQQQAQNPLREPRSTSWCAITWARCRRTRRPSCAPTRCWWTRRNCRVSAGRRWRPLPRPCPRPLRPAQVQVPMPRDGRRPRQRERRR